MTKNNSLLTGIYSGLTNTYSYLAQINPTGVTLESINKARTDSKTSLNVNQSFASYLQSNFTSIDADGDGVIGSNELTDYTNTLSEERMIEPLIEPFSIKGYGDYPNFQCTISPNTPWFTIFKIIVSRLP